MPTPHLNKPGPARIIRPSFTSWIGSLISGVFVVVAFEPFGWWWLGWLALAPAWIALRSSVAVRRNPLRYGYLVGLMFILGGFWWVGAVTVIGIVIMAFVLSIYPALWFLFLARVIGLPSTREPLRFLTLIGYACCAACFWVTSEWLRSWFMKGFNWNELGVSQVPSDHFRQLAALGGVPLVTFTLVTSSVLFGETIWSLFQRWWKSALQSSLAVMLVLALSWAYGSYRLQVYRDAAVAHTISYACIQPNIPELPYRTGTQKEIMRLELDAMTQHQALSVQAANTQPDLLIWPEAVTTQRFLPRSLLGQVVSHLKSYYHGSILLGAEEVENDKLYNTAYLFEPGETAPQRYHKVYLVMLGEYLPWTDIFPWLTQWWGRGVSATPGTVPGHLLLNRQGLSLAPLICFEDTQPEVVNAAAPRHPDFFVTLINAGWFQGHLADWCLRQHLENSIFRCVEHNRPMIRCADTGITCEIDATGTVVAQLPFGPGSPLQTQAILSRTLVLTKWAPTLYDRMGDTVGWFCRLTSLGLCLVFIVRKRPFQK